MRKVTNLAQYRAARQRPVTDWCRWHAAVQTLALSMINISFSAHRDFVRLFIR
jgi:hypothetical protein